MRRAGAAAGLAAVAVVLAGCTSSARPQESARQFAAAVTGAAGALRLGFVPDITDAPALVGLQLGYLGQNLGQVKLEPTPFASGAEEVAALQHGQLDAAYLDPTAAVMAWQSPPSGRIKVIAGVAAGGAELVVRKGITRASQLAHKQLAVPAGGAQEAALEYWLHQHGLPVRAATQASALPGQSVVREFRTGKIAGAWEPAPVDAEMVAAGGRVLVNEAGLWPGGRFSTAVLVVTQRFLSAHPGSVTRLLRGQVQADNFIATDRTSAEAAVQQKLVAMLGTSLPPGVLAGSFAQVTYTNDPLAGSVFAEARHAAAVGLLKPVKTLGQMYDLAVLNNVLRAAGQRPVRV